jgi:hypothetical protein
MWEKIVKKQSRLIAINLLFVNDFLAMAGNRSTVPHLLCHRLGQYAYGWQTGLWVGTPADD